MTKEVPRSHDLSERLVRHAAASTPLSLRERLEEEWLADLHARRGLASRLRFALGCGWASRVIALEQPNLALVSAGPVRVGGGRETPAGLTRRASSLLLVVGLHGALFYAAWSSLELIHKATPPGPLQYTPVSQPERTRFHPDDGVVLDRVRVVVPPPPDHHVIDTEPDAPRTVSRDGDDGTRGTGSGMPFVEPARMPHRVSGAPASGFPNVDDYYPAHSIRAGEAGVTAVQVCVNALGRLEGDPITVRSSGFASLDAASLRLAKAGSGHYRPTTEDGHPVPSCFAYSVRFRIR